MPLPVPGAGCAACPTVAPDAGAWPDVGRPGVLVAPLPAVELPDVSLVPLVVPPLFFGTAVGADWPPPLDPPPLLPPDEPPPLGAGRLPPPPLGAGCELVGRPPLWLRCGMAEAGTAMSHAASASTAGALHARLSCLITWPPGGAWSNPPASFPQHKIGLNAVISSPYG